MRLEVDLSFPALGPMLQHFGSVAREQWRALPLDQLSPVRGVLESARVHGELSRFRSTCFVQNRARLKRRRVPSPADAVAERLHVRLQCELSLQLIDVPQARVAELRQE